MKPERSSDKLVKSRWLFGDHIALHGRPHGRARASPEGLTGRREAEEARRERFFGWARRGGTWLTHFSRSHNVYTASPLPSEPTKIPPIFPPFPPSCSNSDPPPLIYRDVV